MSRFALALFLVACGHAATTTHDHDHAPAGSAAAGDPNCPAEVPGTAVTIEDTDTGAALVFVTTSSTNDLRERTKRWIAEKMVTTPHTVSGDPIAHGMRVVYAADKPDDVAKLQSELRMHAHHLAGGTCKMEM